MEFSLTTLGTASALPTANRYPSAHVLKVHERLFLIDCGEGTQMQLRRAGIPLSRIDNIFISHIHGDHIFGLFGLLSTLSMLGRVSTLYIYAPENFSEILSFFLKQFGDGISYEIKHTVVKCSEPLKVYESKQLEILAFPLIHRTETYGYQFKEKEPKLNIHKHKISPYNLTLSEIAKLKDGNDIIRTINNGELEYQEVLKCEEFTYQPYKARSFAYCSDTAPFKRIFGWLKGTRMIYHEATYSAELQKEAKSTFHSTTIDAANCAREIGAEKLIIGHFSSRYKSLEPLLVEARSIFPETFLAKEGTKFEI